MYHNSCCISLDADKIGMEKCESVVVVSAIFNDHDKIRQPRGLGSETLENVCFFMLIDDVTLKGLEYDGLISTYSSGYKIGFSQFSVWIDAKLQLMVDPLLLIHSLFISQNADMAISKHPHFVHTMEEAMATARWNKWWDVNALKMQMETYCENGLQPWTPTKMPYSSGINIIGRCARQCTDPEEAWTKKDHMNPKLKLKMFQVEVLEQVTVEYRHNLKPSDVSFAKKSSMTTKTIRAQPDLLHQNGSCSSKCQQYLATMWGSHQ
ncbi:hypothetical protein V8G54_030203 [Vigna mungo]|uniref:TOD1/MUCI70 glycosyltransferase-like domain-containing protein n=1 Tax=Vigna mungo TaxID=3915 RepID=A0AAQ3RM69_VIGMU